VDFSLDESQTILKDSVERYVRETYTHDMRTQASTDITSFHPQRWRAYAEMGWLALPFSTEYGGIDGTAIETMILMESFGRGLVTEPYLPTIVLVGGLLRRGANAAQKARWIPALIKGEIQGAWAWVERQAGFCLNDVVTSAQHTQGGFVLEGSKSLVLNGPAADIVIVPARTAGSRYDKQGISLFIVEANTRGVYRDNYRTVDGFGASEMTFNRVSVGHEALLGPQDHAIELIESVATDAIAALGAEALGAMHALIRATTDYTKARVQFGRPIATFQALQHRMVDMLIEYEMACSLLLATTAMLAEGHADAPRSASALKVKIARAARFIGQNAIQLHGGMGMTDDLDVGRYFKRLTAIQKMLGSADWHLDQLAQRHASPATS
jgi:alkylation response protein AidB-like acyl-CoA dehydrogenase